MASISGVQLFIDDHYKQCVKALQKIALIADTGTPEHREALKGYYEMHEIPTGWRVAEAMREVANDVVGNLTLEDTNNEPTR